MFKRDAIAHFGSQADIVQALGTISKSAVSQWGDIVPLRSAMELERLSEGKLKVDLDQYKLSGHANNQDAA